MYIAINDGIVLSADRETNNHFWAVNSVQDLIKGNHILDENCPNDEGIDFYEVDIESNTIKDQWGDSMPLDLFLSREKYFSSLSNMM
jgi:hypothetical protein